MDEKKINRLIEGAMNEIEYVIREVKNRGFEEVHEEVDCFEDLRLKKEFKDVITGEIYESYFLPERHEFDWTIVSQLVEALTSPQVLEFAKQTLLPVAGGFATKAVYDILKSSLLRTVQVMKKEGLPEARREPYEQMLSDVDKLREYFETRPVARMPEIEAGIRVPRERLYPLMKLLGFSHHRRKDNCLWYMPNHEDSRD